MLSLRRVCSPSTGRRSLSSTPRSNTEALHPPPPIHWRYRNLVAPREFRPRRSGVAPPVRFELVHRSTRSNARVGRIHTPHGVIETPSFVPVATNAAFKYVDMPTMRREAMTELVFCNTYHLLVHPGAEAVRDAGGLHRFCGHTGPIITDSGGFQSLSLSSHGPLRQGEYKRTRNHSTLKKRVVRQQQQRAPLSSSPSSLPADRTQANPSAASLEQQRRQQQQSLGPQPPPTPTLTQQQQQQHVASARPADADEEERFDEDVYDAEMITNDDGRLGNDESPVPALERLSEQGIVFRSYLDGRLVKLTPESTIAAQHMLGADIVVPLDELPAHSVGGEELLASLHRTHRWEARSLFAHFENEDAAAVQGIYAVVHGGVDPALRTLSARYLSTLPFDGFAIGGSLGLTLTDVCEVTRVCVNALPEQKPRHLLGIGDCEALEACVPLGVDTFDSCYATRLGRHGTLLLTNGERVHLNKTALVNAHDRPADRECACYVCRNYSLAYLHHLHRMREPTAMALGTLHNVYAMMSFMRRLRQRILANEL